MSTGEALRHHPLLRVVTAGFRRLLSPRGKVHHAELGRPMAITPLSLIASRYLNIPPTMLIPPLEPLRPSTEFPRD